MSLEISFELTEQPSYAFSYKNNRKTFEISAFDGQITASFQYDFDRTPLSLNSAVEAGDLIKIILLPHRIELYVNGKLSDEEWPCGNILLDREDKIESNLRITLSNYLEKKVILPSVIKEFGSAEGWYPEDGVFVGDCMPYTKDEEFHVLYLKDRHHHKSKWCLGAHQWEHISTGNFKTWSVHPTAVPITDPNEASICTGSHIERDGVEYLYYTVRRPGWKPAPISRSISTDGYHFEKDKSFGFTISEKYQTGGARDPKIIRDEDGLYHMLITTALRKEKRGCLAHYVSKDLNIWQEIDTPLYVSDDETQPECPDYFKFKGKYYLIFSLHGKARYMVSDSAFEGFTEPKESAIPCQSVPKAAIWNDRIIFVGFKSMGGYAGSMTFKAAKAIDSGELVFEDL